MAATGTYEENLVAAKRHLARFAEAPTLHLVAGESVAGVSGDAFANVSPIDGTQLGDVASGDEVDLGAAASAAAEAFTEWGATPGAERRRILHRVADGIDGVLFEL